jgi:hypothetical protein
MRPDTLPPDFYSFMLKAARCPKGSLELNAKGVRGAAVNAEEALAVIKKLRPTKHALNVVSNMADTTVVPW